MYCYGTDFALVAQFSWNPVCVCYRLQKQSVFGFTATGLEPGSHDIWKTGRSEDMNTETHGTLLERKTGRHDNGKLEKYEEYRNT